MSMSPAYRDEGVASKAQSPISTAICETPHYFRLTNHVGELFTLCPSVKDSFPTSYDECEHGNWKNRCESRCVQCKGSTKSCANYQRQQEESAAARNRILTFRKAGQKLRESAG